MKKFEKLDQRNVPNILNFYKDIGIDMQIDQFHKESQKVSIEQVTKNTKIKIDHFYAGNEKKSSNTLIKANSIEELENLFKNFNGCNLKKNSNKFC